MTFSVSEYVRNTQTINLLEVPTRKRTSVVLVSESEQVDVRAPPAVSGLPFNAAAMFIWSPLHQRKRLFVTPVNQIIRRVLHLPRRITCNHTLSDNIQSSTPRSNHDATFMIPIAQSG